MFKYKYDDLFNPVLLAMHQLGGSASIEELKEKIIEILSLTDDEINEIHRGNVTKLEYRLAWARTYLKKQELLENSARGVWALTGKGQKTNKVDKRKVKKFYSDLCKNNLSKTTTSETKVIDNEVTWQENALKIIRNMTADAFERLSQRLLRELGFINVEVTGKVGDGGIDGKGILRIGGVLSFHVVFQCKKYTGSISPSLIRDFRGAMIGRADKGLFITTGNFTREAEREAIRAGAPPIDLVNGIELVEKLKELKLGISTQVVEEVIINSQWFDNI
jgi:restriction system protein